MLVGTHIETATNMAMDDLAQYVIYWPSVANTGRWTLAWKGT